MARLQHEGIRGADLVFACIGPALEIFSRFRAVETAEGRTVGLDEYLEKVWEVVGRAALQQVLGAAEARARNGFTGALEEDARLTALFLWTLQSTEPLGGQASSLPTDGDEAGKMPTLPGDDEEAGRMPALPGDEETDARAAARGFNLPFDVVRRFAQPMGIDLAHWTGRIIGQNKGIVRLLPATERAQDLFGRGRHCGRGRMDRKRTTGQLAADPCSLNGKNRGQRTAAVERACRVLMPNSRHVTPPRWTVYTRPCCFRPAATRPPCGN